MIPSWTGLGVFACLYLLGWRLGSGAFVGLLMALPFGSTAFVQLSVVGGSTPLVYTLFAVVLVVSTCWRPGALDDLRKVFAAHRSASVVAALLVLGLVVTAIAPRLFAGESVALLPVDKIYRELPLRPSSKNVSQAGYFALSVFVYFAVAMLLARKPCGALVRRAFFAFCIIQTLFGIVDLIAKYQGVGDVFAPLRTAGYAMLADAFMAGLPRLTGAMPEASTFALTTLTCLGFTYVYWCGTGSRTALLITFLTLVLVFSSTSSTAYAGIAFLAIPLVWRIAGAVLRRRKPAVLDVQAVLVTLMAGVVSLSLFATYEQPSAIAELVNETVIEKAGSESGVERFYFNRVSIRNCFDTYGLGVGLGSSRSSSWPLAVLGQLGLAGVVLMTILVAIVCRGMTGVARTRENGELIVVGNSVCAAAVGSLVAASISGGTADPGVVFFIALAVVTSWRSHAPATPPQAAADEARSG